MITTEKEYQLALGRIEEIMEAKKGSIEFLEMIFLSAEIADYEDIYYAF